MMPTYETAKKTCFFDTEHLVVRIKILIKHFFFIFCKYATKMMKIRRQKYTQHLRLLVITTQRVYNITKKDPYPKEGLFLKDILGITCTPYKDGFVCIHTKEVFEDRVKKHFTKFYIEMYLF